MKSLINALENKILILDGAMGTMIQNYNLKEKDYRGERFKNFKNPLKGNNDLLSITQPNLIAEIHRKYVPYPTSYYLSALARVKTHLGSEFKRAEVFVLCEDFSNPSCHTLKMLSAIMKIKIFTKTSLSHDLWKMSCSDIVIVSRGSFKFAYLSPELHWEHTFIDNFSASEHQSLMRKVRKTFYYISNNKSADKYKKMLHRWRNSARQRHIISQAYKIKWFDYG